MFSWTSVTESKQRKLINFILIGLNVALSPLLVLMAFFCSVLSFPLFPLFTLPCFLIGFPRPLRFWSYPVGYTANFCSDTIYYEQIMPYVTKALHQGIRSSSL
ncbi:Pecanex-like protein 4, partial [Armadillidium nasatum]